MFLTVKRNWPCHMALSEKEAIIPIGRHEIERIPNPYVPDKFWLVLKGTSIGGVEGFWRDWKDETWGDSQVIIEE